MVDRLVRLIISYGMHFPSALFIVISSLVSDGGTVVWKWKFNSNFNNSENWDRHHVPCRTSIVVFRPDSKVPVELPMKSDERPLVELKKLVLSRQGVLSFPENSGGIALSSESRHSSCDGGEIKFVRTAAERWADPDNWLPPRDFINEASPHVERIPCETDRVEFADQSSFYVQLPRRKITLAALKILSEVFEDSRQLRMAINIGAHKFFPGILDRDFDSITLTGENCADPNGCECGNSRHFEEVCMGKWSSQEAECAEPVTPIGFCYPICGAYLLYKDGSVSDIQSAVRSFTSSKGVVAHTSKVNGFVQVVLVEKGDYSGFTSDVAKDVNQLLLERGLVKGLSSSMHYSGLRTNRIEASSILGRFFFAFICAAFVFALMFCTYNKKWVPGRFNLDRIWQLQRSGRAKEAVGFARFENTAGTVEICEEVLPSIQPPGQVGVKTLGFDNPMFSQSEATSTANDVDVRKEEWKPFSSVDTDEESSEGHTDSTFHDDISMKEVTLEPSDNSQFEPVDISPTSKQ